jgi:ADP-ribosylglycohydrolase
VSGEPRERVLNPPREAWAPARLSPRLERLATGAYRSATAADLKPAGDALDLLEAALWTFAAGGEFRDGALAAANLGGHADTVTALYGQLAGAFHGAAAIPPPWRLSLARLAMLEELADRLLTQALVQTMVEPGELP